MLEMHKKYSKVFCCRNKAVYQCLKNISNHTSWSESSNAVLLCEEEQQARAAVLAFLKLLMIFFDLSYW